MNMWNQKTDALWILTHEHSGFLLVWKEHFTHIVDTSGIRTLTCRRATVLQVCYIIYRERIKYKHFPIIYGLHF